MSVAYTPYDLETLFALDLADPEWLVDGMLPLGVLALLSAREKAGKGLLTIDLCASVATGEPFVDAAVMEGPAIYCAAEENLRDVRARIVGRIGKQTRYPFYVMALNVADPPFKLEKPDGAAHLAGMIANIRPILVVLDTLREIHDGAEDSSDDMAWRLKPLREIAHQTNTTIMLNHHMSKAGGFRGSTAIRAAADLEWAFTRADDGAGNTLAGSLRIEGRHGPRQTWSVRFDPETARWGPTVAAVMADTSLRGRILDALERANVWRGATDLAAGLEPVALKTIQNELSRMRNESPQPFALSGNGSRGNPTRYHTLNRRFGDAGDLTEDYSPLPDSLRAREGGNSPASLPNPSGNVPGTIVELTPIRRCVQCDASAVEDALYCERHGGRLAPTGTDGKRVERWD